MICGSSIPPFSLNFRELRRQKYHIVRSAEKNASYFSVYISLSLSILCKFGCGIYIFVLIEGLTPETFSTVSQTTSKQFNILNHCHVFVTIPIRFPVLCLTLHHYRTYTRFLFLSRLSPLGGDIFRNRNRRLHDIDFPVLVTLS